MVGGYHTQPTHYFQPPTVAAAAYTDSNALFRPTLCSKYVAPSLSISATPVSDGIPYPAEQIQKMPLPQVPLLFPSAEEDFREMPPHVFKESLETVRQTRDSDTSSITHEVAASSFSEEKSSKSSSEEEVRI
jgi:hypothetical protein